MAWVYGAIERTGGHQRTLATYPVNPEAPGRVSKPAGPFGNGGVLHNRDHAICDNTGASERTRDTVSVGRCERKGPDRC